MKYGGKPTIGLEELKGYYFAHGPHHGVAELADHVPMDTVAEAFNCGVHAGENDGGLVIRILTLGLRVHPDQIQILPHLLHQFV